MFEESVMNIPMSQHKGGKTLSNLLFPSFFFVNLLCSCRAAKSYGKKHQNRNIVSAFCGALHTERQWPSLIIWIKVLLSVPLATRNRCWCMEMISCHNSGNKTCFTAFQLWEEVKAPKRDSRASKRQRGRPRHNQAKTRLPGRDAAVPLNFFRYTPQAVLFCWEVHCQG